MVKTIHSKPNDKTTSIGLHITVLLFLKSDEVKKPKCTHRVHGGLPCSATMLSYHAQQGFQTPKLSYHAQLPCSATMLS